MAKRTKDSYEHRVNWYKKGKSPRRSRLWSIVCPACGWNWHYEGTNKRVGYDAYRDQDKKHTAQHDRRVADLAASIPHPPRS